jgi:CRP/FNR family cyclic AMP-dependent transcriptional regulator
MLVNVDTQDVSALSQQFAKLVGALLEVVNMSALPIEVDFTPEENFRGFDADQFYVVQQGTIAARYQAKTIYTLQVGEILMPDIAGSMDKKIAVFYGSDTGAQLHCYSALEFMQRVFDEPAAIRLWTRLLITYAGLMLRITAASSERDAPATLGFDIYEPGDVIIRQGDRANHVYNMGSGVAELLVDGVNVGGIGEGEIFGVMAALTHCDRSASVRAKTRCAVVKVPKDQFIGLIKNHPGSVQALLMDMANTIANLNEQLVGLQGNRHEHHKGS